MGKLKNHQKPMGFNGNIVKMRCARKRRKWGKWESPGNGKIETPRKINGYHWGNTFKTPKKKSCAMTTHRQARTCTHEDTTISFINQFIHVIHRLGAAWLGAARRCRKMGYTVRIGHKGLPLCRQRQGMLHSNISCLSTVGATW